MRSVPLIAVLEATLLAISIIHVSQMQRLSSQAGEYGYGRRRELMLMVKSPSIMAKITLMNSLKRTAVAAESVLLESNTERKGKRLERC